MIVTVECQPKVSISRHLLFVGRFRAMNLGELKEIFDSAGLPLVSSTSSTTGTTGTSGTTSASAGSPGSGSDAVDTLDTLDTELEVQLVLSQDSEALAKSMWRPLRTTGDQISVVSFNMLLKGGVWMGMDGYGGVLWSVMNIFYWCDGRIGARVCQELLGQVQQAGDEMQLCFVWNCLRKGINNIQRSNKTWGFDQKPYYPNIPAALRSWQWRKQQLQQLICGIDADVYCNPAANASRSFARGWQCMTPRVTLYDSLTRAILFSKL